MIGNPGVVSADDVCRAVETTLRNRLADVVQRLGQSERLGEIQDWQQLPVAQAAVAANFPAVAITSPGLTGAPVRDGRGQFSGTWRIGVAVYDRGADHTDTQSRVRDWCAAIRTTLLANRTLDGNVDHLTWAGEEYALFPQTNVARTFAGGAVAIDVTVTDVASLPHLRPGDPVVTSTHPTLTARPITASQE